MPRRQFLQAVEAAIRSAPNDIRNITLQDGENLSFIYSMPARGNHIDVGLTLIATNVDEYPTGNSYILFTEDDVDSGILNSLERLQLMIDRKEISAALHTIARKLCNINTIGQAHNPIELADSDNGSSVSPPLRKATPCCTRGLQNDSYNDVDEMDIDWNGSDIDSDNGFGFEDREHTTNSFSKEKSKSSDIELIKIQADLQAARDAGFRVGVHGNLIDGGVVCVSIRVTRLGISEEAMKAWTLSSRQYLVLLIRFKHGYRDLNQFKDQKFSDDRVEMHVALCNQRKPSLVAISEAFDHANSDPEKLSQQSTQPRAGALEPLFIGKPLNDLLRDRFASIIRLRSTGMGWTVAEKLFNETQGSMARSFNQEMSDQWQGSDIPRERALPEIVLLDELDKTGVSNASLPLVAMQFVLRHFVRCTEFCLACHCLTDNTFEALKPYVCSKPLCLYQFLSYGFGPPVEHEILSQPYVVDLLISLCFGQAAAHKLQDVPLGLNLKVPLLPEYASITTIAQSHRPAQSTTSSTHKETPKIEPAFYAQWCRKQNFLTIDKDAWNQKSTLNAGDWIVIIANDEKVRHCRIKDILLPKIHLFDCLVCPTRAGDIIDTLPTDLVGVECYTYHQDFDALPRQFQYQAILAMLKCVPSVSKLRQLVLMQRGKQRESALHYLREIPQAARDLLRWVIASNRSCIVQVDTVGNTDTDSENLSASEPRVAGMEDWIQFRFAQGAPDKEQRFVDSIKKHATNTQQPTIFAWHGSPIYNWHSIIRHGLNFDQVLHGRASGHGVYMSSDLGTSIHFSKISTAFIARDTTWINSELHISQVVSLQEVVNAPRSFVCTSPHFVVAQKEWIQSRYLFVKSDTPHSKKGLTASTFEQDPNYVVRGADGKAIQIPTTAIPKTRRPADPKLDSITRKERKAMLKGKKSINMSTQHDSDSEPSDEEDLQWFDHNSTVFTALTQARPVLDNYASIAMSAPGDNRKRNRDQPRYMLDRTKTNFIPGTLDISNVKILPPPADASPAASQALMKALQTLLDTQETTPLDEIGYYIDSDRIENMYQWIVELHSFDQDLPLSKDMTKAGLTSIVLELRFTNQFPFAPPFVRVVKPRFLPFLQGGGGHVTEGGAICMELLTNTGWTAVSSIESILLQIRLAMSEKERPARLLTCGGRHGRGKSGYDTSCYGISDAVQAFKRACSKHGWQVPAGVDALSSQG